MQTKEGPLEQIKNEWNRRAVVFGKSHIASWGDLLIFLENKTVSRYLKNGERILDAGCANGYCTMYFGTVKKNQIEGLDYSIPMIQNAKKVLSKSKKIKSAINFKVGNVLTIPYADGSFDKVISKRTIINLPGERLQRKAILEYHRVLKKNGMLLLCEATLEGLKSVNVIRNFFKLKPLPEPWHNYYVREKTLLSFIKKYFKLVEVNNFSATYYFVSRVLFPYFEKDAKKIVYNSPVNKIAIRLPNLISSDFGTQKLFILKKK